MHVRCKQQGACTARHKPTGAPRHRAALGCRETRAGMPATGPRAAPDNGTTSQTRR